METRYCAYHLRHTVGFTPRAFSTLRLCALSSFACPGVPHYTGVFDMSWSALCFRSCTTGCFFATAMVHHISRGCIAHTGSIYSRCRQCVTDLSMRVIIIIIITTPSPFSYRLSVAGPAYVSSYHARLESRRTYCTAFADEAEYPFFQSLFSARR